MTEDRDELLDDLRAGRQRFLAMVEDLRPELHRYCARMTGSIADGEDIVQETLARAYYALPELEDLPPLRPWLFQIAHRRALDHLRRYDRRMVEPLGDASEITIGAAEDPSEAAAREEAMRSAFSRFLDLAPAQRSAVILKDVLGHSLEEIAELTGLTVPAVKAALHRGRERLHSEKNEPVRGAGAASPHVARYAALFNARDWDGVRAMLSEDVRLDLISRSRRSGRHDVAVYFTNYARFDDWHLVPAWLEGREVLAVFRDPRDARPGYFVELEFADGRVASIRDFRYVRYIADEADFSMSPDPG